MKLKQLKMLGEEEMLLSSLIGKVAERLPSPKHEMPFYRVKQRLVNAGLMVEEFIAQGAVTLRKETTQKEGQWKTLNWVTIIEGKDKVKSLTKGFEKSAGKVLQHTVRAYRLRPDDKETLKKVSSVVFYRSEFATGDFIKTSQALVEVDSKSAELPWKREARFEGYRKEVLGLDKFYLSAKYDGRGRVYYEAGSLEGFKPHGKAYESFLFELERRTLTEEGRITLEILESHEGHLGELRDKQVSKALAEGSTGMTVECDVTNSGLLIAGLGFKSPEILSATNGYALDYKADSHTVFGTIYGLTREEAKKVHTPLLHGASDSAIAKKLSAVTGDSWTTAQVTENNEKAYGKAAHNINAIAQYGREVMSNTRSHVSWVMPDGFRATHRAYTVHVPLELELPHRKVKMYKDMPLLLDGRGNPVYDSKAHNAKESTRTKMMGLYADVIHSIDGYVMREVINSGIELLCKHDAFLVHPNDVSRLKSTLKEIYSSIFEMDIIRSILKQIVEETGVEAPELFIGSAEDKIAQSEHFLSVE